MSFLEAVRVAVASLRANKLRSFLTVLGILIGVSSVVAVVATGAALVLVLAATTPTACDSTKVPQPAVALRVLVGVEAGTT